MIVSRMLCVPVFVTMNIRPPPLLFIRMDIYVGFVFGLTTFTDFIPLEKLNLPQSKFI